LITLELVTLDGIKLSEEVFEVIVPTPDGLIAIFPHHMPLISLVSPGIISVRRSRGDSDAKLEHYATNGGIIEIDEHRLRILVDEADHSNEITLEETEAALKRAKE
jgi:F-type H+-transporting ATPase subunit epsilon